MAKIQHTHKLKRLRYKSGNEVFFCTLPDCSFKSNIALSLGKRSICWRCGSEFLMDEYSLRLAKPHCAACHKPKGLKEPLDEIIPTFTTEDFEPVHLAEQQMSLSERLQATIQSAKRAVIEQDEEI